MEEIKKKRGRPKTKTEPTESKVKKPRGRPKSTVVKVIEPKVPKKKGRPSKTERLRAIENEFNLAESLVEELGSISDNIQVIDETLPSIINTNELINFDTLKQDFGLVRSSIINLMATGQTILNTACLLDISDMKPSQIEALSTLQSTVGGNIKLLLDCYKTMSDIEKSKIKATEKPASVNNGEVINNNILFQGSSTELLEVISKQIKG